MMIAWLKSDQTEKNIKISSLIKQRKALCLVLDQFSTFKKN